MSEGKDPPLKGDIMDVEGVAEYLGLAPSTVYDKVRKLQIPHTRISNLIRFRKVDIDQWLGANTVRPHPTLESALAEAVERFFYERWLQSVGLDPDECSKEEALEALRSSVFRLSPESEEDK
jgi:excisionase family DNA binding protein